MKQVALGLDTSNYRTSLAVISLDGKILFQSRELLPVARGERGLRQSDAVYLHSPTPWEEPNTNGAVAFRLTR